MHATLYDITVNQASTSSIVQTKRQPYGLNINSCTIKSRQLSVIYTYSPYYINFKNYYSDLNKSFIPPMLPIRLVAS